MAIDVTYKGIRCIENASLINTRQSTPIENPFLQARAKAAELCLACRVVQLGQVKRPQTLTLKLRYSAFHAVLNTHGPPHSKHSASLYSNRHS
jgi:hypothetical protein